MLPDQIAPGLSHVGFVTNAVWFDIDQDGQKDLIFRWNGVVLWHFSITRDI